MGKGSYVETYRSWSIVVTVGAWDEASTVHRHFVPTVAVVLPGKLQQRFVDVGDGAAFANRSDALHHGIELAKSFIDATVNRS